MIMYASNRCIYEEHIFTLKLKSLKSIDVKIQLSMDLCSHHVPVVV